MAYSPYFEVLHDEQAPVGNLGRGTHYSILRTLIAENAPPLEPEFRKCIRSCLEQLTLAVIWDEDHDTRVIGVLERMHGQGLLAPVRFIGERKGNITMVLDPELFANDKLREYYESTVQDLVEEDAGDSWQFKALTGVETGGEGWLINADQQRTRDYLKGIQASWRLGIAPWVPATSN